MKSLYLYGAAGILSLYSIKRYFNGGVCSVRRDLTGQVAIVTGGNTGIGKQTAIQLAKQNCSVIIGARDNIKSAEAVEQIKNSSKNKNIEYINLELGSKVSIQKFVESVSQKYNRIDILVNNAGVMMVPERRLTQNNFQMQMGVNHLGHFYLTYLLWQYLKKSENLRIINVSSNANKRNYKAKNNSLTLDFQNFNFENGEYHPYLSYSRSKLANVLFTQQLAERMQKVNKNARTISLHPGVVRTELVGRYISGFLKLFLYFIYPILYIFTKNSNQGAQTSIYGVFEDKNKLQNGKFYADCKQGNPNPSTKIPEMQKRLWEKSQELLGIKFIVD